MITIEPPSSPLAAHPAPSRINLTRFLNRAQAAVALPGTIDVLLTSDAELKRLNRTFRGKNKPTDVLSFPADPVPGLPSQHQHAGDLAISLETAARQAAHFGHTLDLELRILLLHGLLHLAGHDHETDSGQMAALESSLRAQLKLPSNLIARTLTAPPTPRSSAKPATRPGAPRPASGAWERSAPTSKAPAAPTKPKSRGAR